MTPIRRMVTLIVWCAATAATVPHPVHSLAAAPTAATISSLTATRTHYDPTLGHNVSDLSVTVGAQSFAADFLTTYENTGGLDRWGHPTSEVFQEEPGNLAQYYQRGVLDWHWRADLNIFVLERRLAWDYVGGDRAGPGLDQGAEPPPPDTSTALGPWGHTVSDTAVDGTPTGFAKFYQQFGGVGSFGYPKTEARLDDGSGLHLPSATTGFIRQYFQAAVFEYHPDNPQAPVELRLLGDDLRDATYPQQAWQQIVAFQATSPRATGDSASPTSPGGTAVTTVPAALLLDPPRVQQGRTVEVHVTAAPGQSLHGLVDSQRSFALSPLTGGYWGIVGIDPWASVGRHTIAITADGASGTSTLAQGTVDVVHQDYPWLEDGPFPPGKGDITQRDVQVAENRQLAPIFTTFTPQQLWGGTFIWPAPGPITNAFGTSYSADGGKTLYGYHEGIDIGANTGTPIVAANNGRVVVAHPLHVRGNGVIIDHGIGIFSGYYHMSRIVAQEGTTVRKGDLIGYVGETGLATGPHVHWEIRAQNQYVDPAEWLTRDIEP